MRIWRNDLNLSELNKFTHKYLTANMGIEVIEIGDNFIKAKMPVDERTKMPVGLLHGGASCVLAESLGSYASVLCIDLEKQLAVGLEINANHIRSVSSGFVVGVVHPIHIGRTTHVWDIRIHDQENRLTCVSRLTIQILDKT